MNVYEVKPFGYCAGVYEALRIAELARHENPDKSVYLLGMIVHNEETLSTLEKEGFIPLDERKASLKEQLAKIPEGQVVIFSAHGHDRNYEAIAAANKLKIYDATCHFVLENLKEAFRHLDVIYIGVKGHLESQAFLANARPAAFYDVSSQTCDFSHVSSDEPYLISQTTLSGEELQAAHQAILAKFPHAIIGAERCHSTSLRQQALTAIPKDVQAVIVLGSERSNNSLKLKEIATSLGFLTYLVLDLDALKKVNLKALSQVALASGASTSTETFSSCADYLRSLK